MTDLHNTPKQTHIIIGYTLMSKRTLRDIKFDPKQKSFLNWLAKEKVFVESDSLGITKMVAIGYLTKLHLELTNQVALKELLLTTLKDAHMDANLAIELDPSLKSTQTEAMSNRDLYILVPLAFEVYKMHISHSYDNNKVKMDIIGIKCAMDKSHILKEFFSQLESPVSYEKLIGVFVPMGAAQVLGTQNYSKIICNNNAFIQSITTIPISDMLHAILDIPFSMDSTTDINTTNLYDMISDQPWCLNIKQTKVATKVDITTTKDQLATACAKLTSKTN